MKRSLDFALVGVVHLAAFALIVRLVPVDRFSTMDIYFDYGTRLRAGQVPYRDFVLEYPPLAAPLFRLPAQFAADLATYRAAFALEVLTIDLLGVAVGFWALERFLPRPPIWGLALAQPLWLLAAGRALVFERFDLAPAVLALLAIALYAGRQRRAAWVVLGLATALKLYPAVIAPLFVLAGWRDRASRTGRQLVADLGAFAVAIVLPAALVARGNLAALATFVRYHLERGLEVETIYASPLLVGRLAGRPARTVFEHGASEIVAPLAPLFSSLALPLTLLALGAVYLVAWRSRPAQEDDSRCFARLIRLGAAAVLAFMLAGKVLSPQFLLWLYPLLPLVDGRRAATWTGFGVALLLSRWIYPDHWLELLSFGPRAIGVLLVRNGLLLALGALLLAPLVRRPSSRDQARHSVGPILAPAESRG